jgi:hypothetical protein
MPPRLRISAPVRMRSERAGRPDWRASAWAEPSVCRMPCRRDAAHGHLECRAGSARGRGCWCRTWPRATIRRSPLIIRGLVALDADVILLTAVDYDRGGVALGLLADRVGGGGAGLSLSLCLSSEHRACRPGSMSMAMGGSAIRAMRRGSGCFPAGRDGGAVAAADGCARRAGFSGFLWRDLPGRADPGRPGNWPMCNGWRQPASGMCRS